MFSPVNPAIYSIPTRRHAAIGAAVALLWLLFPVVAACSGKTESKDCGEHEQYDATVEDCVCVEGYVRDLGTCTACGANEVSSALGCICAAGYSRSGGSCEPAVQTGQGAECDPDVPCSDAIHSYCCPTRSARGYCTNTGCKSSADCAGGYYCDLTASPSVCRRPPTGQDFPCAGPADCEGFDADYCESLVSGTCLVRDCSESLNNCSGGHHCCDFAGFGLPSLCISAALSGGVCTEN